MARGTIHSISPDGQDAAVDTGDETLAILPIAALVLPHGAEAEPGVRVKFDRAFIIERMHRPAAGSDDERGSDGDNEEEEPPSRRRGTKKRSRSPERIAGPVRSRGGVQLATGVRGCPFAPAARGDRQHYPRYDRTGTDTLTTPWGDVGVRYSRYAPFIQTNKADWGGRSAGDYYRDWLKALRTSGLSDTQIALRFLSEDPAAWEGLPDALHVRHAAAKMHATVHVAEEWRKAGAAKVFRAILWSVLLDGQPLDSIMTDFGYIPSAQEGMAMVGRFQDEERRGDYADPAALFAREQRIYDLMSDDEDGDLSSDDEWREDKDSDRKASRLYARHHQAKRDDA